jgi:hypothetical protein
VADVGHPAQRGEYIDHVRGATVVRKINVWDVGGRNPAEKAAVAVELLREVTRDIADVSSASATLLLKELAKLYGEKGTPTTRDVVEKVERVYAMRHDREEDGGRLIWLPHTKEALLASDR